MLPTWILSTAIIIAGCIAAYFVGSGLSGFEDPWLAIELIIVSAVAVVCAIYNNFPFLYALGLWLPLTGYKSVPNSAIVAAWICAILFFRLCKKGSISYVRSFHWIPLTILSWVPIRFMMNPVTKLGSTIGGSGVSGAMPYFLHGLSIFSYVLTGAVLPTREKLMQFMRMQFWIVGAIGSILCVCAFTPATAPVLHALGFFDAGEMGDGIQRIVLLPGYGLFLIQVALCPACFRLSSRWVPLVVLAAVAFIIIGGNRSGVACTCVSVPIALILRKKPGALLACASFGVLLIFALRLTVDNMSNSEVPPLLRSFGVLDSKIDEASGGTGSAAWRYAVWQSGWQKIMEHPLVGKGFGNLPQRFEPSLVPTTANQTTDFEAVLAGGMAHNGYVVTAYGFGLPFTVLLTGCMVFYMLRAAYGCLNADPHDAEVRDAYAFYACVLASLFVAIYAAADLHSFLRWASCIALLANLERRTSPEAALAMEPTAPGYGNQPYATAPYRY